MLKLMGIKRSLFFIVSIMFLVFLVFSMIAVQAVFCENTVVEKDGTGIIVKTIPPKAKVYIDGAYRGLTPFNLSLIKSGKHTVKIKKDFFDTYTIDVIVPSDGCVEINVDLIHTVSSHSKQAFPQRDRS
ncbi:hypothetical protein FACS1894102_2800 [Spirochaetia bacterium]|nr:hypothetical protein FACS1894102_2800 [Spirochaetia bacterium]